MFTSGVCLHSDGPSKDAKQAKIDESSVPQVSQQPSRKAKNKKKDDNNIESTSGASTSGTNGNISSSKQESDLKPPDNTVETEEQFHAKTEVKIKIPDELKPYLVDDWDYLTRQRKLVILPSRMTVDQIIISYVKSKSSGNNKPKTADSTQKENAILEVTAGLRYVF